MSKGELPLKEYPSMSEPSSAPQGATQTASTAGPPQNPQPMSMRSRRTPQWAKSRASGDSQSRYKHNFLFGSLGPYEFRETHLLQWIPSFGYFLIIVNWIGSDSSVLRHSSGEFKRLGNRIFVFMIGGATRSEVRCVFTAKYISNFDFCCVVYIFIYHFTLQWISCARCTSLQ